jgi:hypothetical protein
MDHAIGPARTPAHCVQIPPYDVDHVALR